MTKTLIPHTALEAAEAFKRKDSFVSIHLEADKNPQDALQALAFRMMTIVPEEDDWTIDDFRIACQLELKGDLDKFTEREVNSAESLAFVALKNGYAKTIAKFPEAQRYTVEFESPVLTGARENEPAARPAASAQVTHKK